jgi:hypothetical protein
VIFFFDRKSRKDQYEYKNVINTQTPLHQVGTEILKGYLLPFLYPHKYKKGQRQRYPKKSLMQGLSNSNGAVLFTHQPQVEREGHD